ncbi:MAG: FixH family protein [Tepidisphaerales bacterium]
MSVAEAMRVEPGRGLPLPGGGGWGGWWLRARWPLLVVGLLLGHVLLMSWAILLATRDRDGVVIPNSYARSLEWDRRKAEREATAAAGWRLDLRLGASADERGMRPAVLRVVGRDGVPVAARQAEVLVYHEAVPAVRHELTIQATEPGVFETRLPMGFRGFYHVEVRAEVQRAEGSGGEGSGGEGSDGSAGGASADGPKAGVFVAELRPFVADGPLVGRGADRGEAGEGAVRR